MDTRITSGFHVAHQNDDDVLVEHYQDVEPTLDYCARMRKIPQRPTRSGFRRVASLPAVIYYDWLRKGIIDDKVKFRQALEEYRKLKVVDDKLWIPATTQKQIYAETGIVK